MNTKQPLINQYLKTDLPEIRPGDIVKVHQKIKEGEKERIQIFEGLVIAKKHGNGINGTITVRKIAEGVGVERIFPIHSTNISKIEVISHSKVRRAKLYFLRDRVGKSAKLKRKNLTSNETNPTEPEPTKEESPKEQVPQRIPLMLNKARVVKLVYTPA